MSDALGWREKFGILAPSTNTIVEPEFYMMGVPGVTSHFSRIHIRDHNIGDDTAFEALMEQIRQELAATVERVMTAQPDYMIMGMSSETFWGGVEENRRFKKRVQQLSGLEVANGAEACERALKLYNAQKIGVVTPYQPIGDKNVMQFFDDLGVEVVTIKGLKCPTAVTMAHVPENTLREALAELNTREVDALVQVGTNLSMVRLADEAERWIGKPVIAINAVTWWMALRDNDIQDKLYGFGGLLREF